MSNQMLWYAAYGSNMLRERFRCYLTGGVFPGAKRVYPGARRSQRHGPAAELPLWIDGGVYFATSSPVWGGGRALYDPDLNRKTAAAGYLITARQFSDIVAQEMYREPGTDLDLHPLIHGGERFLKIGEGHYDTLVLAGWRGNIPVITFTAPWSLGTVEAGPLIPPSGAYLTVLARGLCESRGWNAQAAGIYLAGLPGAAGKWRPGQVARLLDPFPECSGGIPRRARRSMALAHLSTASGG